ncbi:hypothetical protein Sango_2678400 [Sesamum angolense]|uniref:Uncharacterized protein n=1 Tax=Sesamum angolense TaxID=2727404 RepID=A0AAE1W2J1_9LAMI|nr:hypothetical protein Sango_2678400 [Sesamum angolense]
MGLVEDVLVKVNDFLFSMKFYILKMGAEGLETSASSLLGRPFMKTSKTQIDVDNATLFVEFDGEVVKFDILDARKYYLDEDDECVKFIGEVAPSQSFGGVFETVEGSLGRREQQRATSTLVSSLRDPLRAAAVDVSSGRRDEYSVSGTHIHRPHSSSTAPTPSATGAE